MKMCVYCNMGDWEFRRNPPWKPLDYPTWPPSVPAPLVPQEQIKPWPIEQLREYYDLLKKVKEMEDQLGCPCEPNKADYLALLEERIAALEKRTTDAKA